jgi:diacylglycerol kinase family enzyme
LNQALSNDESRARFNDQALPDRIVLWGEAETRSGLSSFSSAECAGTAVARRRWLAMSEGARALEPAPEIASRRVEILVNPTSGGVGPKAAGECERLLETMGLSANIFEAKPPNVASAIASALEGKPDVLVILAGDGTARTAAALAGPHGTMIAPLPGGTMNLLPQALYGSVDWRKALSLALTQGVRRPVAGGLVGERPFYVAAILGSPALWAPAREAMRTGKLRLAYLYARRAARRAFSRRLRFRLDGQVEAAEALTILSPLISKAMHEPTGLEVARLNLKDAGEAFRLAATALFSDWRTDPAVETASALTVSVWARNEIPAILDGEPIELGRELEIRFLPQAFTALAPPRAQPGEVPA